MLSIFLSILMDGFVPMDSKKQAIPARLLNYHPTLTTMILEKKAGCVRTGTLSMEIPASRFSDFQQFFRNYSGVVYIFLRSSWQGYVILYL